MKNLLTTFFIFFAVISGIIFIPLILALLFMGSGYAISYFFKLSLFEASLLCIGGTFAAAFIVFIAGYGGYNNRTPHYEIENDDCNCLACTFKRKQLKDKINKKRK